MKNHFAMLFCMLIFCGIGGGCIVLDGKSTKWEEKNIVASEDDTCPGNEDGLFKRQVKELWEIDTHENIAIGFFPGFACDGCNEYFRKRKKKGRYDSRHRVGHWCEVAGYSLFVFPTVCSAFIEPFGPQTGLSEYGIVGCHRWKENPGEATSRYCVKTEIMERQLLQSKGIISVQTASITLPIDELGPTTVYMEYPGFNSVMERVAKEKRAAVVIPASIQASVYSGAAIELRCFRSSAYDKQALAYEDIQVGGNSVLGGHVRKYSKVKEAGEKAVQLKGKDQQVDEVLQPLEKELALQTALQLSDARVRQIEGVLVECREYLGQVAPVKKRVDDLCLKAPEDQRLSQLSNLLEFKAFSSAWTAEGIDLSKLQDEVATAERHSKEIGRLTNKAAALADRVPDDKDIVLRAAQCKDLMPCSVSDSELYDLGNRIAALEKRWSEISRLLGAALSLQNKIPENDALKSVIGELKSDRPSVATDERLSAISRDITSMKQRVDVIVPLATKANSILKELPENEEIKKVCGQLDLRGKNLPDEDAISEMRNNLLRIENATERISKMKKRMQALERRFPADGYLFAAVKHKRESLAACNANVPSEAEIGEMESAIASIEADALARKSGMSHLNANGSWRYESELLEFAEKFDPSVVEAISTAKKKMSERSKTLARLKDALSDTGRDAQSDEVYCAAQRQDYADKHTLANVYRKLEIAYVLFKKSQIFPGNARIAKELDAAKADCREATKALDRKHDSKLENQRE